MDLEKKLTSTPNNNIGAYKRSLFSQRTENRDKDKQSAEDSKGASKKTFFSDDGKGDFLRWAFYPQLPYLV